MAVKKTSRGGQPPAGTELVALPASKAKRAPRQKPEWRPSQTVRDAIDLLNSGQATSNADAARQLGRRREYISRQLSRPEVKMWMLANVKNEAALSVGFAWKVKRSMLSSSSDHVASDCASEILAIGGIIAPKAPTLAVQINNHGSESPGYALDLSGWPPEEVTGGLERGELEFRHGVISARRGVAHA